MINNFKNRNSFIDRKNDCARILLKYPDRIPVLCEKYPYSRNAPDIDKHKYLVGFDLTLDFLFFATQFVFVIV